MKGIKRDICCVACEVTQDLLSSLSGQRIFKISMDKTPENHLYSKGPMRPRYLVTFRYLVTCMACNNLWAKPFQPWPAK
eukprot:175863-Pelagomonas_calceolata.AAC.2